ncbi:MAG TPA: type IV pilus assembly protein PilM [Candidatus Pacearchaeota archaeon]|nr:type IV pilus assembly protein PilM [Candidatus Pacearchaeota archaeon]HOK94293.1 type IV pilus assembly protein PilM [Candidatus Pacearchaeota archaeon]HPO75431.1 type IV pilus assembly protein PilM [Candidatus Pacearchaeota archaeon]
MLFRKSPSILGIDIGTASVKIVELQKDGKVIKLKNYGEYQSPVFKNELISTENNFLNFSEDRIVNIIKKIIQEAKIETREANFSLPVFSSFFTVIDLPSMEPEEIPEAVRFQANQYIPVPVSEVVLDWTIIEGKELSQNDKIKILLVAVPKEIIEKYANIGKDLGLVVKFLEMENFAQVRALVGQDKSPVLLVDIGGKVTSINIVDEGFIRLCSSVEVSSFSFIRSLSERLSISFERAEALQKEKGLKKEVGGIAASALTPVVDKIIFGIERAMNTYVSHNPKREIQKIILSGGTAKMPGLTDYISSKLKKETIIGNPFLSGNIDFPPVLKSVIEEIGPSFSTAVGLALREFEEKK